MPGTPAADRKQVLDTAVDVAIRLAVVGVIVVWCFRILDPFLIPLVWGVIIAVAIAPLFGRLTALTGGHRGLTAVLFTLVAIAGVIGPTYEVTGSAIRSTVELDRRWEAGTLTVPAPNESVRDWPVIGDRLYEVWDAAHTNLRGVLETYQPQVQAARAFAVAKARSLAGGLFQTVVALIIAGFMLTYASGGEARVRGLATRLGGTSAEGLVGLSVATIRSVAQGVLGVAVLQAAAAALGMVVAGIPAWGVWTVLVLILAVVQLPPLLVLAPVAAWYFTATDSTVAAVLFLAWAILVSISDALLKPLFLGRGVSVPMPVILFGAIGGVVLHGIIGLFVGAVVLAIGYQLFQAWMRSRGGEGAEATAG
jgi:predicted PurR-regulated permease PerM